MILRFDRHAAELPPPSDPDPAGARVVQELMYQRRAVAVRISPPTCPQGSAQALRIARPSELNGAQDQEQHDGPDRVLRLPSGLR